MIKLKPIEKTDIEKLKNTSYADMDIDKKIQMILESNEENHQGNFFKFFLVQNNEDTVGVINIYSCSKSVIRVAPEIKVEFRGKGYAKEALLLSYDYAKGLGYKLVYAGIKEDNIASIRLHEKLGFEYVQDFLSSRGKKLKMFIKII
ncbi:MAG: GNAT family N-acetyltransferase [Clostridiales bacterium]|nr:GNAT family N-acetyltransferase [Clostridiales bacterium]